jgi:hypothetical protein
MVSSILANESSKWPLLQPYIAMNINSLLGNTLTGLTGGGVSSSQSSSAVSPSSQMLSVVDNRIQTDVDSTTAQLSKFGLLKSAVSSSQVAAHALTGLSSASTASDLTSAMGNFFNAFNSTILASKNSSSVAGSTLASQSAIRVTNDLKRAITSDSATQDAMKKLGLTIQSDGTLVQDAKKFGSALSSDPAGVRAALATIGKQIDIAATKELATNGRVDAAMSALSSRSVTLAAQQKALKALESTLASTQGTTSTLTSSSKSGLGLAAYQSNSIGI